MNHRSRHDHRHSHPAGPIEGRASRVYDVISRRVTRPFYRRLAADVAAAASTGAAVLDIGTGPGVLLMELARCRPDLRLVGADVSGDMIDAARRNLGARAEVRVADVGDLPFDADGFDLVVASLAAHHWSDPGAGADEIARVLRPGGRMLVYDLDHAPFDTLAAAVGFGPATRTRFRTGLGPLLRCDRFEAVAR